MTLKEYFESNSRGGKTNLFDRPVEEILASKYDAESYIERKFGDNKVPMRLVLETFKKDVEMLSHKPFQGVESIPVINSQYDDDLPYIYDDGGRKKLNLIYNDNYDLVDPEDDDF